MTATGIGFCWKIRILRLTQCFLAVISWNCLMSLSKRKSLSQEGDYTKTKPRTQIFIWHTLFWTYAPHWVQAANCTCMSRWVGWWTESLSQTFRMLMLLISTTCMWSCSSRQDYVQCELEVHNVHQGCLKMLAKATYQCISVYFACFHQIFMLNSKLYSLKVLFRLAPTSFTCISTSARS